MFNLEKRTVTRKMLFHVPLESRIYTNKWKLKEADFDW